MDIYRGWIAPDPGSKLRARCKLCTKSIDISGMGESALKSHANGDRHKKLAAKFHASVTNTTPITSLMKSSQCKTPTTPAASSIAAHHHPDDGQNESNTTVAAAHGSGLHISDSMFKGSVSRAEILWTLRCIENHHSYSSNQGVGDFFASMFPDSQIAAHFKCGETKTMYITKYGLAPYFSELLRKKVSDSEFVLLFDESLNHKTKTKQMDIHIRYWDTATSTVCTRFLDSKFLGHATADIMKENFVESVKCLQLTNLYQISMDGPNVNWKFHSELAEEMRDDYNCEFLNIGSCGLHVLHGSFKDGLEASGWEIDSYLTSSNKLFKDAPARSEDFKNVSGSQKLPAKFCKHRWLENVSVANQAIEMIPHMKKYVKAVKEKKIPNPKNKSYETVSKMVDDPLLEVKLHSFVSFAHIIEPFLQLYQTDKPMIMFVSEDLHKMLRGLMARVLKPEALDGTTAYKISSLDATDKNKQLPLHKVNLGFTSEKQVKHLLFHKQVTEKMVLELRSDFRKCVIACVGKIQSKAPLKYSFVRAVSCISPKALAGDKAGLVSKFDRVLSSLVAVNKLKSEECDGLKDEFSNFLSQKVGLHREKFLNFDYKSSARADSFFYEIIGTDPEYTKLWKVVKIVLILSHGQAEVERGFSTMKQQYKDNLHEESFTAQRVVLDHITHVGGSMNVEINKTVMKEVSQARMRYQMQLEANRRKEERDESSKKRKALEEEIATLQKKRKLLQLDLQTLEKSANEHSVEAEKAKSMSEMKKMIVLANSHRQSYTTKSSEVEKLESDIEAKMKSLIG